MSKTYHITIQETDTERDIKTMPLIELDFAASSYAQALFSATSVMLDREKGN